MLVRMCINGTRFRNELKIFSSYTSIFIHFSLFVAALLAVAACCYDMLYFAIRLRPEWKIPPVCFYIVCMTQHTYAHRTDASIIGTAELLFSIQAASLPAASVYLCFPIMRYSLVPMLPTTTYIHISCTARIQYNTMRFTHRYPKILCMWLE